MTRYAKLVDGAPIWAPNPVLFENRWVANPAGSVYTSLGYKPVCLSAPPEANGSGAYTFLWSETENALVQSWNWVPSTELSDAEALNMLLGGDDIDP